MIAFLWLIRIEGIGSYNGVIKREALYKGTNKDDLPEAKPSKGKMLCPRARAQLFVKRSTVMEKECCELEMSSHARHTLRKHKKKP